MKLVDVSNLTQEKDYGLGESKKQAAKRDDLFNHFVILFAGVIPIIALAVAIMYLILSVELSNDIARLEQVSAQKTQEQFKNAVLQAKVDLIKENTMLSQRIDELEQRIMFLEYAITSPDYEIEAMEHPVMMKM